MNDGDILVPLEPSKDAILFPGYPTTRPENRQRSVRVAGHDYMIILF